MANDSSNLIYIIGLLYSLIIVGIIMYIISKASEEKVRCKLLGDQESKENIFEAPDKNDDDLLDVNLRHSGNKMHIGDHEDVWIKSTEPEIYGESSYWHDEKTGTVPSINVSYTIDGTKWDTELKCNNGTFERKGIKHKIKNNKIQIEEKQTDGTMKWIDATPAFSEGEYSNVQIDDNGINTANTDGIIVKAHKYKDVNNQGIGLDTTPKFCLISTNLWENHTQREGYKKITNPCLLNYHIKTAYNCCAINSSRNSFVNECALKYCIDQGARCLDFEIYSVDDRPVVGVSSKTGNTNMKESYNKIALNKVLDIINSRINNEPIILHFRIKSDRNELLKSIEQELMTSKLTSRMIFNNKLYGDKWSYKNYEKRNFYPDNYKNVLEEHIGKFNSKNNVIISLDLSETKWRNNAQNEEIVNTLASLEKLWTIVNLMTPNQVQAISINKVTAMTDSQQGDLRAEARKQLVYVQPDPVLPHKDDLKRYGLDIGCQLVGAPLQFIKKNHVLNYKKFFKDANYVYKSENAL